MKNLILIISLFFGFTIFSQDLKNDKLVEVVDEILSEKPKKYFDVQKYIEDRNDISEQTLQRLIKASEEQNYLIGKVFALNLLGKTKRGLGNYKESIDLHEQAFKIASEIKNIEAQIHSLNLLGVTYNRNSNVRKAIESHQKALKLAAETENPSDEVLFGRAVSQNSVGEIFVDLKQYDMAIELFKDAIAIHKKLNQKKGLAINYLSIGIAYERNGQLKEAESSYKKALSYSKLSTSKAAVYGSYNSLVCVSVKQGKLDDATEIVNKIQSKLKNSNYPISYARNRALLAWIQFQRGEIEQAEENLMFAYDTYKANNVYNTNFSEITYLMSEFFNYKKEYKKSLDYLKESINSQKNIDQENFLDLKGLITNYNLESKNLKIKELKNKTELQDFQTSRTRNVLIITLVSLALLSVALYSIYRQRLLNNDKKVLSLEQQALQAQMNPHFLFNALNSIKLYIINNEQRQAVYYLNKFSKLIRNILDSSKSKEVSLKEELETMELYMSIENIRFNNEIKYIQKINDNLNLDTIKVPPLILQPFLENSIWHGLSSKVGKKEVILSVFKVSKNFVEITIADTGVGREAAMEIKKNKSLNRNSVGIDLTKERLKTFTLDFSNEHSLEYHDLKDEEGNPAGTKVSMRIPLT